MASASAAYDYVIIGGGSAGCVLAARLSEMPDVRVLLLEAGPRDSDPYIHMPVGFFKMTSGPLIWGFETAPLKHANNRVAVYPQARVLGGGSSINAEIYTRGCPEDYDAWETEFGCKGWSWRDLKPYFLKSEDNSRLSGTEHGVGGPLGVTDLVPNRVSLAFVQGCQDIGMPFNPDFNSGRQAGCGIYQATIRNGRRCSVATGYLKPVMSRPNLMVRTDRFVTRILVEKGRATGVEVSGGSESLERIEATRDVVLTAGAIGSPKLLMLSGVGPAEHLRSKGVDVVHGLPGVGQNFHDHFSTDIIWQLNGPHSYDKYKKLHWKLWAGLQYLLFRSGPVASNIVEGGAFWWSDRNEKTPDLQLHFLAGAGVEEGVGTLPGGNGATCNVYHTRPHSRGSVTLASNNPADRPIVDPNSFAEPYDLDRHIDGIKLVQEIGRSPSMARFVEREHFPGPDCKSRVDYEAAARANARSSYHPVGTCKMGVDKMAVVGTDCRVHGIERLRVCDSSIMPRVVSSNTNAATIAIAEKAADMIRGNR